MLLWATCLLAVAAGAPPEGIFLQDGRELNGRLLLVEDGSLSLEGQEEPIPFYELLAIRVGANDDARESGPVTEPDREGLLRSRPIVRFRDGTLLTGRVLEAGERNAQVEVTPSAGGEARRPLRLRIPLEGITGFRLREAIRGDSLFEEDLGKPPTAVSSVPERSNSETTGVASRGIEPQDAVYVRRANGVLRVDGIFVSLDAEYLTMRLEDRTRRLRRDLVQGVILAPVASRRAETDIPATLSLVGVGHLPGFLESIRGEAPHRDFLVRFRGAADDDLHAIQEAWIREIRLSSDRVLFLSSTQPTLVEETPLVGTATTFPFRRDGAASGGPLRMDGRTYRKGIGAHPRSILEFDIGGRYASLAGVLGLDDSSSKDSGVTFRIIADGKEIYTKPMKSGEAPENLSIPIDGVRRLRLVVDFGDDGVDFGDYANWADLRVTQ